MGDDTLLRLASILAQLGRQRDRNDELFGWLDEYTPTGDVDDQVVMLKTMRVMLSRMVSLQMLDVQARMITELTGSRRTTSRSGSWLRRTLGSVGAYLLRFSRSTKP